MRLLRTRLLLGLLAPVSGCAEFQDGSLGKHYATPEEPDAASDASMDLDMDLTAEDAGVDASAELPDAASVPNDAEVEPPDAAEDETEDADDDAGDVSWHCRLEPWECP